MSANLIILTTDNFESEVLQADVPVLVDMWAPWCGPCKMIGPVVEQIAEENGSKAKVCKLNVDDHPSIAQRYGVTSIPMLIVFKNGQPAATQVGLTFKPKIQEMIDSALD